MKKIEKVKYRWSDMWLLASIALASKDGPAELWQVFFEGDQLNHALFTSEEIESGLVRLSRGGLIKEVDKEKKFYVTDKFLEMKIKIKGWDTLKKLVKIFKAEQWDENEPIPHPDNNLAYPGIDSRVLITALEKCKKNYHFPE